MNATATKRGAFCPSLSPSEHPTGPKAERIRRALPISPTSSRRSHLSSSFQTIITRATKLTLSNFLLVFTFPMVVLAQQGNNKFGVIPALPPTAMPVLSPTINNFGVISQTQGPILSSTELQSCVRGMLISDLNRDDLLSQTEYLGLLNRMTNPSAFLGASFSDLPNVIQDTYARLTLDDDSISIYGSKPGQTPTEEQLEHLTWVCQQTATAIDVHQAGDDKVVDEKEALPTTTPEDAFFMQCKRAVIIADTNRDDWLTEQEFLILLNRVENSAFADIATFSDLPAVFQEIYQDLSRADATNDWINIVGSKPGQTPTSYESAQLKNLCSEVSKAIRNFRDFGPLSPPTGIETELGMTPTQAPGTVSTSPPLSEQAGEADEGGNSNTSGVFIGLYVLLGFGVGLTIFGVVGYAYYRRGKKVALKGSSSDSKETADNRYETRTDESYMFGISDGNEDKSFDDFSFGSRGDDHSSDEEESRIHSTASNFSSDENFSESGGQRTFGSNQTILFPETGKDKFLSGDGYSSHQSETNPSGDESGEYDLARRAELGSLSEQNSQSEYSQSDYSQSDYSQSEYSQSEYSQSEYSQSEHSQSELSREYSQQEYSQSGRSREYSDSKGYSDSGHSPSQSEYSHSQSDYDQSTQYSHSRRSRSQPEYSQSDYSRSASESYTESYSGAGLSKGGTENQTGTEYSEHSEGSGSYSDYSGRSGSWSEGGSHSEEDSAYTNSIDEEMQAKYRDQIEKLVALVVPDEIDNVSTMMEQFIGREEELILTLKNMAEYNEPESGNYDYGSQSERTSGDYEEDSFYSESYTGSYEQQT